MKKSEFTEELIIAILREQEAGAKTAELPFIAPNPNGWRVAFLRGG
ncbi:hypothetical protein [Defluviimonas salinarum]|nr:hypothetical protein [Defluviimonas salinarum]